MKKMKKMIDAIRLKAEIDKYIKEMKRRSRSVSTTVAIFCNAGIRALEMAKDIIDDMIEESEVLSNEEEDGESRTDRD